MESINWNNAPWRATHALIMTATTRSDQRSPQVYWVHKNKDNLYEYWETLGPQKQEWVGVDMTFDERIDRIKKYKNGILVDREGNILTNENLAGMELINYAYPSIEMVWKSDEHQRKAKLLFLKEMLEYYITHERGLLSRNNDSPCLCSYKDCCAIGRVMVEENRSVIPNAGIGGFINNVDGKGFYWNRNFFPFDILNFRHVFLEAIQSLHDDGACWTKIGDMKNALSRLGAGVVFNICVNHQLFSNLNTHAEVEAMLGEVYSEGVISNEFH